MRESTAISAAAGPPLDVSPALWGRSGRPFWGTAIRFYIAFSLIWIGLYYEAPLVRWGLVGAGVVAFIAYPALVRALLRPLERRVAATGRSGASGLLRELRAAWRVRRLAPHAWLPLQEARLHLAVGDGKAAMRSLADLRRLAGGSDPAILRAQVHAALLAGDPKALREAMSEREAAGALGPWDRLHRAIVALDGGSRGEAAVLEDLEAARAALGDHPWVLAALTLAHERSDRPAEAEALAALATAALADHHEVAAGLLRRAEKGLRTYRKAQQRRERRGAKAASDRRAKGDEAAPKVAARASAAAVEVEVERAPAPEVAAKGARETVTEVDARSELAAERSGAAPKTRAKRADDDQRNPKGSKKARQQARREARRQAKAEERRRKSEEASRRRSPVEHAAASAASPTPGASERASEGSDAQREATASAASKVEASASVPAPSVAPPRVESVAPASAVGVSVPAPSVAPPRVESVAPASAPALAPGVAPRVVAPASAPVVPSVALPRVGSVSPPSVAPQPPRVASARCRASPIRPAERGRPAAAAAGHQRRGGERERHVPKDRFIHACSKGHGLGGPAGRRVILPPLVRLPRPAGAPAGEGSSAGRGRPGRALAPSAAAARPGRASPGRRRASTCRAWSAASGRRRPPGSPPAPAPSPPSRRRCRPGSRPRSRPRRAGDRTRRSTTAGAASSASATTSAPRGLEPDRR
ncbi:MAG: hypothetical protein H6711_10400 [Myxococcales bacterium]|nr:hypothetical protein [Myxococcales bacterium]